MFAVAKFYILVGSNSFIIKKEGSDSEDLIELQSFIPNVPAYCHLFDQDKKDYIEHISKQIKKLKIKNATIILPDDSMDIEVDKRLLTEFFSQLGVKKVETSFQCFHLKLDSKKYISISKTSRVIIMQYITYNKSISKKYYDKNNINLDKILLDMKYLHNDCENATIPIFVNNLNFDMEEFKAIGDLVSLNHIISNVMNHKMNN